MSDSYSQSNINKIYNYIFIYFNLLEFKYVIKFSNSKFLIYLKNISLININTYKIIRIISFSNYLYAFNAISITLNYLQNIVRHIQHVSHYL